jgi:protease-4
MQQPPTGQGPIEPQGAFSPPPPPGAGMPPGGRPPMAPPPFYGPPMPFMYPPPKPPREKSFARAIFTTLATTVFSVSLLLNLYLLAFSGVMHGEGLQRETTLEKGDAMNRIVVLPISGIINDDSYEQVNKKLKTLADDKTLRALIIEVNSPGGSVTASDEIYQAILNFKAKAGKPVVVYQRGLAASGGYYISCAGDYIVAQRTTMTGNIGVLLPRYNLSEMLNKWGVKDTTLKSDNSPFKNVESMTQPETPEANAYLKAIINAAYDQFADVVKTGRAAALDKAKIKDVKEVANGKIYLADEALKNGLIDQIGDISVAIAEASRRAGVSNPAVIQMKERQSILDLLGGESGHTPIVPPTGQGSTHVELNALKLDASGARDLLTPRLMYLWDGN